MNQVFLFVFLMLAVCPAYAQPFGEQGYLWVEPQVAAEKGGEYFSTISLGQKLSPRLGLFLQTAHGNFWGETVFGPTLSITPELEVGTGIGIEHYSPRLLRFRLHSYYDHKRTGSFLYTQFDAGKTGSWVWVNGARMFGPVGVGALVQMPGGGAGPKLELRAGKHIGIWAASVYEWNEKTARVLIGTRFMFDW